MSRCWRLVLGMLLVATFAGLAFSADEKKPEFKDLEAAYIRVYRGLCVNDTVTYHTTNGGHEMDMTFLVTDVSEERLQWRVTTVTQVETEGEVRPMTTVDTRSIQWKDLETDMPAEKSIQVIAHEDLPNGKGDLYRCLRVETLNDDGSQHFFWFCEQVPFGLVRLDHIPPQQPQTTILAVSSYEWAPREDKKTPTPTPGTEK